MEEKVNKPPKLYFILKIVAFCMLGVGLILVTLGIIFGKMNDPHFDMSYMFMIMPGAFLAFLSLPMLLISFLPNIQRARIATVKYVQNENKEDLTEIVSNSADIAGTGIKKTARAIKEGLKNTKYCKYCGEEIDADSLFCNKCGKQQ